MAVSRIVYRYFSSSDLAFPRLSLHPQSLQRPPYRTNVPVGAGDHGRAAWASEVMVLECQTRGSVEGLHAVSLGDLFDIRRAVWRVWGHGFHGRALGLRRTIDCSWGSNGTSRATIYRCGYARLLPVHLSFGANYNRGPILSIASFEL